MIEEMISKFKENHPKKQLILLFKAGSHFFDLNGPASDTDYRGLYIDSYQDSYDSSCKGYQIDYKTKIGGGKNTSEDTDFTLFSLTTFIRLLKQGDFNSMEMLFAPEEKILYSTPIYWEIRNNRSKYLINDVSSFLGFVKKEYKRYGVNIFHYDIQKKFIEFVSQFPIKDRMSKHWDEICKYAIDTEGVGISKTKVNNSDFTKEIPAIVVAQRLYPYSATIEYVVGEIGIVNSRYGHRQKSMASSGVEFKGLYHALRCIYEANDLLDYGELKIPFDKERHDTLRKIKNGEVDQTWLFDLIDRELKELSIREKYTKSNRLIVGARLEKLENLIRGKFSIWNKISLP